MTYYTFVIEEPLAENAFKKRVLYNVLEECAHDKVGAVGVNMNYKMPYIFTEELNEAKIFRNRLQSRGYKCSKDIYKAEGDRDKFLVIKEVAE